TYSSSKPDVVEINNNTLTVHKYGEAVTITASQNGKEGYINPAESKSVTITPDIGTIQFDNNGGNKNWNNSANWLPINTLNTRRNVEPSAVVNGVITAEAVISNAERNEINNLTFETEGKLTIGAKSGLKVNAVTNATAEKLILKSSAEGNATFIYNSGEPSATVEMYSKATQGDTPEWQYIGVAVNRVKAGDFKKDNNYAWLLKWEEKDNVTGDPWSDEPLAAETTLMPWAGYSISQPQPTTYTMSGSLMNDDKTYTLTRTTRNEETQDPDCGFNLLANSYTAPIDITKLTTDDFVNADACIVLYNTGTYGDWEKGQTDETNPKGQLTVIPVEAAKAISEEQGLPTTIPSMQAFFVRANSSNASFTVNYSTDVAGAEYKGNQMRAPRAEKEFNVLKIMIEGENTRDRLYLLENEETSEAYDNGYEASKIFDAPRGHQMYATCQYGYASIDCSESFVGQTIGLKGDNDGEMLTISFDTERLDDYKSLYLYDKATGKYVNIIAGEEYTFFGIRGADDNRFSIVTNPDDENQTPPFVVIGEELAFDKSQIDADNANIYIYDTSGRLLIMDKINPYENYNIPNMPNGIYLVNMNGYTTKIVKK
ncbi:MAG: T9SS type A sorting domain-containing protein, partial [Paludibacteraceae bacterium]|nr:T9SS type A sorting domain-containing protein [Paludibacteraceae bacterium]